jgi:hypothetical protein
MMRVTIKELRQIIQNILQETYSPLSSGKTWFGFNFGPSGKAGARNNVGGFGFGDLATWSWSNPWPEKWENSNIGYTKGHAPTHKYDDKVPSYMQLDAKDDTNTSSTNNE